MVDKYQKIYFLVDVYSSADFIIVYATLLSIMKFSFEFELR